MKKTATDFGKFLRKLRVDRSEPTATMASRLGVSVAYVSSVELGHCSVPKDWVPRIISAYRLDDQQADELREAAHRQQQFVKIGLNHCSVDVRKFVLGLSEELKNMKTVSKKELKQILGRLTVTA